MGKTDANYFSEAIPGNTKNRLVHYIPFEMRLSPDIKNAKNLSESQQKEKEGELILKSLQAGDYLVLLDEKGKEFTSMQFASYLGKENVHGFPAGWYSSSAVRMDSAKQFIRQHLKKSHSAR